jgi:hypothetical protein
MYSQIKYGVYWAHRNRNTLIMSSEVLGKRSGRLTKAPTKLEPILHQPKRARVEEAQNPIKYETHKEANLSMTHTSFSDSLTSQSNTTAAARPSTKSKPTYKAPDSKKVHAAKQWSIMGTTEPPKKKDVFVPPSVALSERDRAPQLILSPDQMEVSGITGGYRLIRATHGVHNGAYFWEAEILDPLPGMHNDCHVRLGWCTRKSELQAPVGNDKHGFGYRDKYGSKCHNGIRDDSYGESYGPGDVIGCFLYLDVDNIDNNQMRFFLNGIDQGVAYKGKEIPLGVYFPAVSVYMKARVRVNFGPSFIIKHDIFNANAVSEVQPMNPEDRRAHDVRIATIRETNKKINAESQ